MLKDVFFTGKGKSESVGFNFFMFIFKLKALFEELNRLDAFEVLYLIQLTGRFERHQSVKMIRKTERFNHPIGNGLGVDGMILL